MAKFPRAARQSRLRHLVAQCFDGKFRPRLTALPKRARETQQDPRARLDHHKITASARKYHSEFAHCYKDQLGYYIIYDNLS